jgi:hypothetical protein
MWEKYGIRRCFISGEMEWFLGMGEGERRNQASRQRCSHSQKQV